MWKRLITFAVINLWLIDVVVFITLLGILPEKFEILENKVAELQQKQSKGNGILTIVLVDKEGRIETEFTNPNYLCFLETADKQWVLHSWYREQSGPLSSYGGR